MENVLFDKLPEAVQSVVLRLEQGESEENFEKLELVLTLRAIKVCAEIALLEHQKQAFELYRSFL